VALVDVVGRSRDPSPPASSTGSSASRTESSAPRTTLSEHRTKHSSARPAAGPARIIESELGAIEFDAPSTGTAATGDGPGDASGGAGAGAGGTGAGGRCVGLGRFACGTGFGAGATHGDSMLARRLPPPPPASKARPPKLIYPVRQRDVGEHDPLFVARVTIDTDGFVVGAHLVRGVGGPRDAVAADQIFRFRYRPALDDDGRPVKAIVDQPFLVQ